MTKRFVLLGSVGFLGALAIWQFVATFVVTSASLASPMETGTALVETLANSEFWEATGITILMAARGLVLAILVGVVLGILIGTSKVMHHALRVPIEFLKPIPPIVIMPSTVLVLGPTLQMGEFLIFYGCVLPIIYQTAAGVKETDPVALETARSYGMGRVEILYRVILPSTAAFIGTAVRIALPGSLIIAVVAGLLGGGPGLGRNIFLALGAGDYPYLYALVVVLGIFGLIAQSSGHWLERRFLHWHPSYRTAVR